MMVSNQISIRFLSISDQAHVLIAGSKVFLGGFLACTEQYIKISKITHVVNTARGLRTMYPAWSKVVTKLEANGSLILVIALMIA